MNDMGGREGGDYTLLLKKLEGKRQFGGSRRRWEENI
jgi:hypothetical protein